MPVGPRLRRTVRQGAAAAGFPARCRAVSSGPAVDARGCRLRGVALIARRVARLLEWRGLEGDAHGGEAPDVWSKEAPVLAVVAAASVEGRVALGPRAGVRVRRCGNPPGDVTPATQRPCHARRRRPERVVGAGSRLPIGPLPRCRRGRRAAQGPRTSVMLPQHGPDVSYRPKVRTGDPGGRPKLLGPAPCEGCDRSCGVRRWPRVARDAHAGDWGRVGRWLGCRGGRRPNLWVASFRGSRPTRKSRVGGASHGFTERSTRTPA